MIHIAAMFHIAMFLQKAWCICNAHKRGPTVNGADDVADGVESASMRHWADDIDARA